MSENEDHVDPEEIREELLELADVIRRLDDEGELLEAAPELIKIFGNLRSQLFEYEVRHTKRLFGKKEDPPEVLEAQRIIDEAARQLEQEDREWWRRFSREADE